MTKPEIVFSSAAREDLRDIQAYIAVERESPQTALGVIEQILDRIEKLSDFPDTGTLLFPKVNFPTNHRYVRAAGYLAFYRHEADRVFIDRIIHGKRDYITILFPSAP